MRFEEGVFRNNPKYIYSLGRSIVNLSKIIPNGLLIFFPSYPILEKCREQWEDDGILSTIREQKVYTSISFLQTIPYQSFFVCYFLK